MLMFKLDQPGLVLNFKTCIKRVEELDQFYCTDKYIMY